MITKDIKEFKEDLQNAINEIAYAFAKSLFRYVTTFWGFLDEN